MSPDMTQLARGRDTGGGAARPRPLKTLGHGSLAPPLSALSFWFAIALPAIYLPLLASGIETRSELALFLALFAGHLLALVAGRSHRSGPEE